MQKLRVVSILLIAILAIVVGAHGDTALAGNATQYHVQVNDVTIPWNILLEGDFCSDILPGVVVDTDDFGSDRVKKATVIDLGNGNKRITVSDLVKGTATDNFGDTYTFLYQNNANYEFDGKTVRIAMKDTFWLRGGDVNLILGFNWRWAYPANSLDVFEISNGNGQVIDLAVDPFVFATNDGVNEDPGIIPGSWQQLSTRGDPWNCDPL